MISAVIVIWSLLGLLAVAVALDMFELNEVTWKQLLVLLIIGGPLAWFILAFGGFIFLNLYALDWLSNKLKVSSFAKWFWNDLLGR